MARSLITRIINMVESVLTSDDGSTVSTHGTTIDSSIQATLASGTGLNQADQVWESVGRSLTVSGGATPSDTFDFNGTSVIADKPLNSQGEAVALTKIKKIRIRNRSTDASAILAVGNSATPWEGWLGSATGGILLVKPGGYIDIFDPTLAGMAVTAGSADKLKVANLSATAVATYDILVVGVKA